ncbi:m7GpppN-mRNA hydrolase [Halotydeus destructor]|nr:m7GpppN-mRNA hydrolase [Halotydeus destructor]
MNIPPIDVLDDISSRFIINVPAEERTDVTRIMFQIELAHWFYLDWLCEERSELPKLSFKPFSKVIFQHVPFLRVHIANFDQVLDDFRAYKSNVPTYGAIIVDPSLQYCLMVQGYYAKTSWGFPKGKVNHDEDPYLCAIREVKEETGFDCADFISKKYIEKVIRGTTVRLYIVPGVSKETKFQPMTRCEIKNIDWFKINDLPEAKTDKNRQNANAFFMAMPFIKSLRDWVRKKKRSGAIDRRKVRKRMETDQSTDSGPRDSTPCDTELIDLHAFIRDAQHRSIANHHDQGDESESPVDTNPSPSSICISRTRHWENVSLNVNWSSVWSEVQMASFTN